MTRVAMTIAVMAACCGALAASCARDTHATHAGQTATATTLGCDHDRRVDVELGHVWPYAGVDEVHWAGRREATGLHIKPRRVSVRRDTVRWKTGARIEVQDTTLIVTKPRRVVARQALALKWVSQPGRQGATAVPEATVEVGQAVDFLAHDADGTCYAMLGGGVASGPCAPSEVFEAFGEGVPVAACAQTWWLKVKEGRHRGWLPFDSGRMQLVQSQPQ